MDISSQKIVSDCESLPLNVKMREEKKRSLAWPVGISAASTKPAHCGERGRTTPSSTTATGRSTPAFAFGCSTGEPPPRRGICTPEYFVVYARPRCAWARALSLRWGLNERETIEHIPAPNSRCPSIWFIQPESIGGLQFGALKKTIFNRLYPAPGL